MAWSFSMAQDIGGRPEQQDRVGVFAAGGQDHLAVVADGMGGYENGAAAAEAVMAVAKRRCRDGLASPRDALAAICADAHRAINALGGAEAPGSTCVILYASGEEAYWAHVGDGRLYHFRNGEVVTQTQDHSVVQLMVEQGRIGARSALGHALQNQLYMRLGGTSAPQPDFDCVAVESGDSFLLCSDGLWANLPLAEIERALRADGGGDGAARLVQRARARGGPGSDNISAVVATWSAD